MLKCRITSPLCLLTSFTYYTHWIQNLSIINSWPHDMKRGQGIPNDGDKKEGRMGWQCDQNYNLIER